MCDPVSLTVAATAVAAAGTVVSGVNQSRQYAYKAKVDAGNAKLDQAASADAANRGAIEEQRQYRKNAQILGAQRAALAANGVEVDFGSAADLQADTKRIGQEDAATIRENTIREQRGFEISAANNLNEAAAGRASARSKLVETAFDTGKTILGGAKQVSSIKAARAGATV